VWQILSSLPYRRQRFFLKYFLALLSIGYRAGAFLARKRLPSREVFSKPVISVGSVIAGGSGKTTFTHFLAQQIGQSVALLSHGYRGKKAGRVESIAYGDEAFLLQQKLPCAKVFAGKDRVANAKRAMEEGVDYILLDSGMQVDSLHKDFEIAVVHYDNLQNHWHFLPRGLLRESPYGLQRCCAVVVHGVSTEEEFQKAEALVRRYTTVPLVGVNSVVTNKEVIRGKRVGAFTGIGHPERFYQMVEEVGGEVVCRKTLADHAALPSPKEFLQACKSKGAELVVCTEKDFIKLASTEGIVAVQVEMQVLFGKEAFTSLLNSIKKRILSPS
jgi:tetraacyldisaccharide 4'-kinase